MVGGGSRSGGPQYLLTTEDGLRTTHSLPAENVGVVAKL